MSSYCPPRNLRKKSAAELRELAKLGLSLVYVGAESGEDEVLARVNKAETLGKVIEGALLDSKAEPMAYRESGAMDGTSALFPVIFVDT